MRLFDGTMMYNRYFVQISSAVIGIWIFFFVFWLSYRLPNIVTTIGQSKWMVWLDDISFEMYLVHMWFLNGKWQVANYVDNPLIAYIIVFMLTLVFASILHAASQKAVKTITSQFSYRQ